MLDEKVRVPDLARMKSARRPIAMLTAYDYPFARIFDLAGVDVLLVGDSLATAVRGEDSTLAVTIDEIIYHTRAVARARKRALLVADMPFLSYQVTPEDALRNAGRLIKEGGAEAVKLEGGVAIAETVLRLAAVDIPVMGHVGLTPQSVHRMGGHRVQGRKSGGAPGCRERLVEDALALEAAGAFALVVEGVPASLGREIAARVHIPAIGIGAGPDLDGQVLVMHDMLGLGESFIPRFAKPFAALWKDASAAAQSYVREVRERAFPAPEHCYAEAGARAAKRRGDLTMQIINHPDEMARWADASRARGERIALVPTMGFLHDGHLALMRQGRARSGALVASIFVNPAQFGPNEDLARYPRDFERDLAMLETVPVDVVFAPDASAMYSIDAETWVEVTGVTRGLCGPFRPGHFRGVTTIVAKLFNIVKPHLAVFGEKDFQQLRAIERMVADLNFDLEILPVPIVREKDGLAMSSRNAYLSPDERERALALSLALRAARDRFKCGSCCVEELVAVAARVLRKTPGIEVEYVEAVDARTLVPARSLAAPLLIAIAARVGKTRLIDNTVLTP